jgi:hypothetical protein
MILASVVAVYLVVVATIAWLVARLLRRWVPAVRVPAVLAVLVLAALFFVPIPIHGGFLLLGPEMAREGLAEWRRDRAAGEDVRRGALDAGRFAGWIPETAIGDGWRDPATGLVWSPPLGTAVAVDPATLADAKRRCADLAPAGYWALPRNAEFFWLARTDHATSAWLADAYLWPEGISVATRMTFPAAGAATAIRCVAVTPPAPARGYRAADVPLAEWNAFQLQLMGAPAR